MQRRDAFRGPYGVDRLHPYVAACIKASDQPHTHDVWDALTIRTAFETPMRFAVVLAGGMRLHEELNR